MNLKKRWPNKSNKKQKNLSIKDKISLKIKDKISLRYKDKIRRIDPLFPQPDMISEAANIIKKGGVVSFPTKCLYGLGADAYNPKAVAKVFEIKQRLLNKPLLVLINANDDLHKLVKNVPKAAQTIMDRFWPGEITIVFEAKKTLPVNLTAKTGKIGVRVPEHRAASALIDAAGFPITGTSANISSGFGCSRICNMDPLIAEKLDLILDAGPLKGGAGSTVIDVTIDPPKILREGEISVKDVLNALRL